MTQKDRNISPKGTEIQVWARELLESARMNSDASELIGKLAGLSEDDLDQALPDDDHRKAFWINLYNAFNLLFLKADPSISDKSLRRMRHFSRKGIAVAGRRLSLMQIENDLLRRGRLWWSLGYLSRVFHGRYFRRFRPELLDPRIHFALNCGAVSCPPIRFYLPAELDSQLDIATAGFMRTEVRKKSGMPAHHLYVSSVFRLYRGDFGGRKGIGNWILRYRPDLAADKVKLHWLKWDWTSELDAFV